MREDVPHHLALLILRLGVACVFLLFGFDKLPHAANWLVYVPSEWIRSSGLERWVSLPQMLWLQGFVELILGANLLLGVFTRISAAGCMALLALIIVSLGLDPAEPLLQQVVLRDIGLCCSSCALMVLGPGGWSLDAWLAAQAS
ncbi:MAG: DoxX family protein [Candidatus Omnitrophica bacterium]|nr:DoxX family protein [Candidatus Omnitrophota bacterium]